MEVGKNMSLSKTKMFLAVGFLLAVTLTMVPAASAGDWDGRLWKPYQPEQFGGSRRSADGFYGTVEAIYWKLDGPRHITQFDQASNIAELEADFQLGTRVTFGNQRGHHGWRFSGYGIDFNASESQSNKLDWSESGTYTRYYYEYRSSYSDYRYTTEDRWAWMNVKEISQTLKYRASIIDLDLAWTYRAHPFRWGEFELFAGVRYWDVNDALSFFDNSTHNIYRFSGIASSDTGTATGGTTTSGGTSYSWTTYDSYSPISTNLRVDWLLEHQVTNRVVGPNLGFNLTRRNRRWTFGAMPSVFLGVNNQSFRFKEQSEIYFVRFEEGPLSLQRYDSFWVRDSSQILGLTRGELQGLQIIADKIGLGGDVLHKQHRSVFSPGIGLQLSAKWQWTDAIGIKVGFDSTIMSNVARGSDLMATPRFIDGPMDVDTGEVSKVRDGYDFSLRSKGDTVILYGVSIGLELKR